MNSFLDNSIVHYMLTFYELAVFYFAVVVMSAYILLAIISLIAVRKYVHKNTFTNYESLLTSTITPSVSILAPAYNEAVTIVENIRSLLSIHYPNMEVIVINDGSKDNTMPVLISAFNLVKIPFVVNYEIETKEVLGVYKSTNKAFDNLVVVNKINGGKADALNVGLNISTKPYVTSIDADCILEQDALLKLMKPFEDQTNKRVIATGGVVRIINSCKIESGKLVAVRAPRNWVARFQALEYIRAFLLGRMAWSSLDGLLIISGAIGIFDRKITIAAGGYNHKTVGEDMELVVRMRRYMHHNKLPYKVAFVPDPLCWTEVPESWKVLQKQRNRWTRGTIETLRMHRSVFLNPSYGKIGLLSYPFWLFFEWLAPIVEFVGIIYTIILISFGLINWPFFLLMVTLVYSFAIFFSVFALLLEEITYHAYHRKRDILALFFVALIEPFCFHPFVIYSAIRGNIDYLRGKTSWDKFERKGFSGKDRKKMVESRVNYA